MKERELAGFQAALMTALYDTASAPEALAQLRRILTGLPYEDELDLIDPEMLELAQIIVRAWARD